MTWVVFIVNLCKFLRVCLSSTLLSSFTLDRMFFMIFDKLDFIYP